MISYWWIPKCYTGILIYRNWDCSPELLLFITPNDFLKAGLPSVFSRKGKKSIYFIAFIASVTLNLFSSSFWFPDIHHSPFVWLLSQTKFYSDIATVFWSVAKCHWLQLLLCGAFRNATDLSILTNLVIALLKLTEVNLLVWNHNLMHFIALWAAFLGFPWVCPSKACMPF